MSAARLLLASLLLAGCAAPAGLTPVGDAPDADAFVPWSSEGAFFVEPSRGSERTRVDVPFVVNGTEREARAVIDVGSRYGGLDAPRSTAYVEASLLDAEGSVVASARRMPLGEPRMELATRELHAGNATLRLDIGGGSDGEANGDHVRYAITVG